MAVNEIFENADGLQVRFGTEASGYSRKKAGKVSTSGAMEALTVDFTYDKLPTFTSDLNNDGTLNGFNIGDAGLPDGAHITKATLMVTVAFAGGTSYNIGTYTVAGSAIDADGIDAAIALTAIDAVGDVILCDGAQVGGTLLTADGYLVVAATGTFTAGAAKLVVEYMTTE